jgi:hypothetical protein
VGYSYIEQPYSSFAAKDMKAMNLQCGGWSGGGDNEPGQYGRAQEAGILTEVSLLP